MANPYRNRRGAFTVLVAVVSLLCLALALLAPAVSGATTTTTTTPPVVSIIFPLELKPSWTDTFGAPRSGGRTHAGNDIYAARGTPLLAVSDGVIKKTTPTDVGLGGISVWLTDGDGNDYYYAHLDGVAPGIEAGVRVSTGQVIGYAGNTGNAAGGSCHLHFEIHLGGYSNPINPYASLLAAPTYADWLDAGGRPAPTLPPTSATTTTTQRPGTTTTTRPLSTSTTTTTVPVDPGGQVDLGAPPFSDVKVDDWFHYDLSYAYSAGVVQGGGNGAFRPYGEVTRAQFAAFLARAFLPHELPEAAAAPQVFADVPSWFWGYAEIQAAAASGLVKGTGDGVRFAPNAPITRAQMAVMMYRAVHTPHGDSGEAGADPPPPPGSDTGFSDVGSAYWAAGEIISACELGLIRGDSSGCFRPEETANRAHAVSVIARGLRLVEGMEGI